MINSLQVRIAEEKDIPHMLVLLEQLFLLENVKFDRNVQHKGLSLIIQRGKGASAFVAEISNQIIGMCTLQTIISTAEASSVGYIEDFCVDENYRSFGVGSEILGYAESWCFKNGIKSVFLLADNSNKNAVKFYSSKGWKETNYKAFSKSL